MSAALPIGGFMPIPLAMMIPFMGIQSTVMAKQFGENFQYGKRKISAMSNEEFNKLTPQQMAEDNAQEIKNIIPSLKESIMDMREIQKFIIAEFVQLITKILPAGIQSGADATLHPLFQDYLDWAKQGGFFKPNDPNQDPGKFNPPTKKPSSAIPQPIKPDNYDIPPWIPQAAAEPSPQKKTIQNKSNKTWNTAISNYTGAITHMLQNAEKPGITAAKKSYWKKEAIKISQELNEFRLRYPASGYNYSNA